MEGCESPSMSASCGGAAIVNQRAQSHERGSTLVEFIILLPLLMLLLFGIFEISRLWLTVGVVAEASREGARTAAVTAPFATTSAYSKIDAVLAAANLSAATKPVT